jgi:hypothetical protein
MIVGSCLAIAGLVVGGAFAAQAAVVSNDRAATTTAMAASTGLHHEQLAVYGSIEKAHARNTASVALDQANQVIAASQNKVDASALTAVASSLASYEILPLGKVVSLTAKTKAETASVSAATAEADRVAAAAAAAAEADRLKALAASNTPDGARAIAKDMAASRYGWGASEFSCLSQLWQKESGWSYTAYNPSGATGIPQALPGSKMASAGSDWKTNATTQIAWGLQYIKASSYGTPCAAWSHSQALNWY